MHRRFVAAAIALSAVTLTLLAPAPASAAVITPPPPPVTEVPDVPSRTQKVALGDLKPSHIWSAYINEVVKPNSGITSTATTTTGKSVVVAPKPITAAAPLVRGATAVPLVGAFTGGFALGQGVLQLYGSISGDDPLDSICGSGFEGVGSVLYMGMMPDCSVTVLTPNEDITAGVSATLAGYASITVQVVDTANGPRYAACGPGGTPLDSDLRYSYTTTLGGMGTLSWVTSPPGSTSVYIACTNPVPAYRAASTSPFSQFHVLRLSTGTNIASAPVVTSTADPVRTPRCRIEWEDGTTTTATGSAYQESAGLPLSSAGMGCEEAFVSKPGGGPDLMPSRISVDSEDESGAITEIVSQPVPDMSPAERRALDPKTGNGRGLVLEKVINGVNTSCMTWAADCANWWPDSGEGLDATVYRCTYAGESISLAECGVYRNTFDTQTATPTITDPSTGESVEWHTSPNNQNSISPGTGPGTGSNPSQDCFDQWSAVMNPIEWVLHPVKCALAWAFQPRPAVIAAHMATLENRWTTTGVGQLSNALTSLSFVPPADGCSGLTMALSTVWNQADDVTILAACPGDPLHSTASLSTVVLGIMAVLGTIFAVTRSFGRVFNYTGVGGDA
jgi:hypothetical protein